MKPFYNDILSRIAEEPLWFTEQGVPRYEAFAPYLCSNLYARTIILLRIACQNCRRQFLVEMAWDVWDSHNPAVDIDTWQRRDSEDRAWAPVHYGDPPAHGCVGDTMNCVDLKIEQFWRHCGGERKRIPELEIELGGDK